MKALRSIYLGLALGLSLVTYGDEVKPAPTMPDEVVLNSGRVLRNVQVIRWEKDRVVLKYSGGVDPIAFSLIKTPSPAELAAIRDSIQKTAAKVNAPNNRTITGQVFVTTRGAGAYKFAGTTVLVFPLAALGSIKSSVEGEISNERARMSSMATLDIESARYVAWKKAVQNFTPIAEGSTDAEGLYRLTVTSKQQVFIFCATSRVAGLGDEYNVWAVPIEKSDRLDLNSSNHL